MHVCVRNDPFSPTAPDQSRLVQRILSSSLKLAQWTEMVGLRIAFEEICHPTKIGQTICSGLNLISTTPIACPNLANHDDGPGSISGSVGFPDAGPLVPVMQRLCIRRRSLTKTPSARSMEGSEHSCSRCGILEGVEEISFGLVGYPIYVIPRLFAQCNFCSFCTGFV